MLKVNATAFFGVTVLVAAGASAEATKSASETSLSIGKKWGYPHPDCYATVFSAYAASGADTKFKGPNFKTARLYKDELFSKCSISR